MNSAIVQTKTGSVFRIPNAFMLGMDHIVGEGPSFVYEIQEGDRVRFVA